MSPHPAAAPPPPAIRTNSTAAAATPANNTADTRVHRAAPSQRDCRSSTPPSHIHDRRHGRDDQSSRSARAVATGGHRCTPGVDVDDRRRRAEKNIAPKRQIATSKPAGPAMHLGVAELVPDVVEPFGRRQ
jgi:hypothetical protein